jgi:hypothetical protein
MTWRLGCRRLRLWLLTRNSQPVDTPCWPECLPQLASQLGVRRRHSASGTGSCPHSLTKIALVIALVFSTFLATAWIRSQVVLNRGESNVNVLKLSWRRSLAAAVVVPLLVSLSQDARSADPAKDPAPPPAAAQELPPAQDAGERPARPRVQRALAELEERHERPAAWSREPDRASRTLQRKTRRDVLSGLAIRHFVKTALHFRPDICVVPGDR